ncbi:MAG TPA: MFS transporter, partial [Planctomycetes bacterium]|nr:MFS transporter [Planctomycetota bacterium]
MNESLNQRWYQGITRYQWLVLFIASAGWAFDVFEGQIFVASMREAMPSLLEKMAATEVEGTGEKSPEYDADHPLVKQWNDWGFGSFLLGGALGGVLFGVLSDRIGRSKTMVITILFYSLFTCVTAFAQSPSQMVGLRFLVAMGVGGEWAVASAMVAEVMPGRTRPVTSSIFHASSVFGTLLATGVGATIVGNEALGWRWGFAIGVTPALLILIIRWKLKEPPQWIKARERAKEDSNQQTGRLVELFQRDHLRNTIVGVSLASIGLVTFWGGHIYGKNALLRYEQDKVLTASGISPPKHEPPPENPVLTREDNETALKDYEEEYEEALTKYKDDKKAAFKKHPEIKRAEMLSMALNTIGGGLGLLFFGTISTRLGRKKTFILYHAVAFL